MTRQHWMAADKPQYERYISVLNSKEIFVNPPLKASLLLDMMGADGDNLDYRERM